MNFSTKAHKGELLFLPLGGSKEIGMNLNLYHLDGKWLMVDLGAGFADDYLPGIDMVVPKIDFIKRNHQNLLGLVLTHAHEDHLGGVIYLWDELRCPIYATPFTACFLRAKLKEVDFGKEVEIIEVDLNSKFEIGPFAIEMVPLTHSAPEMHALLIRTHLGNVFHTGDWKFDDNPVIGPVNDEQILKQYGDEGVLAMVGDSTNVFNEGTSGSEGDLLESLTTLVSQAERMVVVTTFASNVARLETIIKVAENCGRKVVILGRSLWRILEAARDSGYLQNMPELVSDQDIKRFDRSKLLVIATGCQGEPLAATAKLATETHPTVKISKGDTIIFSSKIIPGNDKKIYRLFNHFIKLGVEVLTEKDHFVHVSGHPAREELRKMYQLIRPKVAIPVHGELMHMHEHANMAPKWGAEAAMQIENGDVVRLAPGASEVIGRVDSGYLAIDGNTLIDATSDILKMRRRMRLDGIVFCTIVLDKSYRIISRPIFTAPGSIAEDDYLLKGAIVEDIWLAVKKFPSQNKPSEEKIADLVRGIIRRIIKAEVGKKPSIEVYVVRP